MRFVHGTFRLNLKWLSRWSFLRFDNIVQSVSSSPTAKTIPYHLLQHSVFINFWSAVGCGSVFCCLWFCCIDGCCCNAALCWLARWGRSAVELRNCAMFEGTGVDKSVCPPITPLGRFGRAAPVPPGPPRILPTPGFAGDGGRGCSFFIRRAPGIVGPRGVSSPPTSAFADALLCWGFAAWRWCCEGWCFIASQPLPLFSFIQSYSPSSTSPVFLRAWVNKSLKKS